MVAMLDDSDVFSDDPEVLEEIVAHERRVLTEVPTERTDETDEARARALWRLGESLYRLRRFSDSLEPLEEAEHAASLIPGWELIWARARCVRAGSLVGLRRWAEAAELTDELVEIGDWMNEPYYVQRGLSARVIALKGLGRWQEAAAAAIALRKSLPADLSPTQKGALREALLTQAWAARKAGDPESGVPINEEAIVLARDAQDREPLYRALLQHAELLHAAGRSAEARETLQTVIDTFRGGPEDFAISAVAVARGLKLRMRLLPRRHRAPPSP
jgi:tetratricopeptide (TPR) repeat protein